MQSHALLRAISWLALAAGAAFPVPFRALGAQSVIVERNVNLRRDPSTSLRPIRLLLPPDRLALLDTAKTNDYYHVLSDDDDEGWVWSRNVRVVADSAVVPSPLASLLASTAIDETWAKPPADTRVFVIDGQSCPQGGDGGDTGTNVLKNRVDVPASYYPVTFDAIAQLPYPTPLPSHRHDWDPTQLSAVTRFEGVAVQLTGLLVALKVQTGGSGESTNCHMTRSAQVDWHMAIAQKAGQGEEESVVVETTPRVRISHPKWTQARLAPWIDAPQPVRISGWLLMDPQHRNHLGTFRVTLWEIHPVTKMEVWQDSAWVDVDDIPQS